MLQARIANLHLPPGLSRGHCNAAVQTSAGFLDDEIEDAPQPLAAMCGDVNVSSNKAEQLMSGNIIAWTRADMPPLEHL